MGKKKNKTEKRFHKLINNVVHGKAMENLRNRVDMRLVNCRKGCLTQTSKPSFITQKNVSKCFGSNSQN